MDLKKIFGVKKPIIGALHLLPMNGKASGDIKDILKFARLDLKALDTGGVDGIIIENNYDLPHKINVDTGTVALMTTVCKELRKSTKLPIGISVLWNDYRSALSIAKETGASFVRIPAFVDSVMTDFGRADAVADDAIAFRKSISAGNVAIFADVQVKHAKMVKDKPIEESANDAEKHGADAIIITGKWTGDAPDTERIRKARAATKLPILVGSGLDNGNAVELLSVADGAIVGTALKQGDNNSAERNVKPFTSRIDIGKVRTLMAAVKATRE